MHIIRGKMNNIINREANENNNRYGLGDSQLPPLKLHDGNHTDDDDDDTKNRKETGDDISGGDHEDNEGKDHCD